MWAKIRRPEGRVKNNGVNSHIRSKKAQPQLWLPLLLSHSVTSDSLWLRGLKHTRLPWSSLSLGVCLNSFPLSRWCHPTISSSVTPFSSCPQSFLASGSFPMSQLFTSGSWSIGALSFSISPSNDYLGLISFRVDWFNLLAVQGILKGLLQHRSLKASILQHSAFFMVQLLHPYMTTGKATTLSIQILVGRIISLLFNMLSRFIIAFLPRSKCLLISWLQSPSTLILEPKKIVCHYHCFPIYLLWSDGTGCHDLCFLNVEF